MSLGTTSATTGTLLNLTNSFNSASSTGNVLKVATDGTSNAAVPLMLTNAGTGNSLRVNDDGTDTDTTPFVIDASGNVGLGNSAPNVAFHFVNNGAQPFKIERDAPDNTAASITLYKRRGAGSPLFDTDFAEIDFDYLDGGPIQRTAAKIVASVDGTIGVNDLPSRLGFYTNPDGTNGNLERLRITN